MKASWVFGALLLAACSSTSTPLPPPPRPPAPVPWPAPLPSADTPTSTPDAPFREHAPEPGPRVAFHPPRVEAFTLKNGVRVLFVERHDLPIVSLRVVARAGAADLPLPPGGAALLGALLEQGTTTRSALQISDAYAAIGATHGASADWDSTQITALVLSTHTDDAVALLADLARNASFPPEEVARLQARWAAALRAERTSLVVAAGNAAAAAVYGRAHPYGRSVQGTAEDVERMKRDELVRAWRSAFTPANVTLVAAGDVTKEALATKLEAAFGAWRAAGKPLRAALLPARPLPARLALVDFPHAAQSQIVLAEAGPPAAAADRDALAVMNALLGGMFSSRVNLNLREAHGLTYDARTRFSARRGPGPFTAVASVAPAATATAVRELLRELARVRDEDVAPAELAGAKESLVLALPARFQTLSDVTAAVAELAIEGLPLDEYATQTARIDAVTAADVRRVAQARLHPAAVKVIVAGDRAPVEPALRELDLGAPLVLDAYGDPVEPR